jgi:hypothetical protein
VNRDPFLRIALLAAATVYAVGVALVDSRAPPPPRHVTSS